jgi:hypothetical protein
MSRPAARSRRATSAGAKGTARRQVVWAGRSESECGGGARRLSALTQQLPRGYTHASMGRPQRLQIGARKEVALARRQVVGRPGWERGRRGGAVLGRIAACFISRSSPLSPAAPGAVAGDGGGTAEGYARL